MRKNNGEGKEAQKRNDGKGGSGQVAPTHKHSGQKRQSGNQKTSRHNDGH